jgi:hypothetical protein
MQKFLVCLLTVEAQGAAHFAFKNYNWVGDKSDFKSATAWLRDEKKCDYKKDVWARIEKINEGLPRVSTIKKFYLLDKDFSDQGNMCELTPTLKVKHRVVKQKYYKTIKKIYGKDYKETQAKAQGGLQMTQNMKVNLGAWAGNRTIVSLLFVTKDGKVCIDDGTGCLPSIVLPDQSTNNIANSENIKFVWTQQFCKNTERPPQYTAERTNEDMNMYGLSVTSAMHALKEIVSDGDIGAIYPKLLSDFYKQDLKSAIITCCRTVESEDAVKIKGNNFTWVDCKKKPEYLTLQKISNINKKNVDLPKPGLYIAYMCTASTRAGLFMMTNQDNFSNMPHTMWMEGEHEHGSLDKDLEFVRTIRAQIRKGGKLSELTDYAGLERFTNAVEKLMSMLSIEEDETPVETFLSTTYDFEFINLDREHKVKFLVVLHPTTLSNLNIPPNLKKKHHLVPMAVYEPNHFYMWHHDVYAEMQVSVLSRNREASEMNWRVQHGKGEKGDKLKHKEEKEAIRKDARRWDCMKWHMKLVHWQSSENAACYTDILNDECHTSMTPLLQVAEVKSNWVDEYGEWEREAITICSEADGWGQLQIDMEKSKFTAKFRMKGGTGAASSMKSGSGVNFKSAGASQAWGNSRASGIGSSASMMSSASSLASRSSAVSSMSSSSSTEDDDENLTDDQKAERDAKRRMSARKQSGLSMRDQIKELERSNRERRVSQLKAATDTLNTTSDVALITQTSVADSLRTRDDQGNSSALGANNGMK